MKSRWGERGAGGRGGFNWVSQFIKHFRVCVYVEGGDCGVGDRMSQLQA